VRPFRYTRDVTDEIIDETEKLYDRTAENWARTKPRILSDFIARPVVLEECMSRVRGGNCLDLGCGEGYFTRMLARAGSKHTIGADLSSEMIERAKKQERDEPLGIEYHVASLTESVPVERGIYDIVSAVFVLNYLTLDAVRPSLRHIREYLKPDGCFIFTVPHPFIVRNSAQSKLFAFRAGPGDYFSDRDKKFEGHVAKLDGTYNDVLYSHKTMEDYLTVLREEGFDRVESLRELRVTPEQAKQAPEFFAGWESHPYFLLIKVSRFSR
jgi:SAM-dependent methyltransferase